MWTRQELKNFPSAADGNRRAGSAEVVGSNPSTRSTFSCYGTTELVEFLLTNCQTNSAALLVSYPTVCTHVTIVLIMNTLTDEI